jgi:hypothetical protein
MTTIPDIPRIYTALAEWMSCVMYIQLCPKKRNSLPLYLICGLFLVVQGAFLVLTGNAPLWMWIPCMALAIGLMFLLLYLCCDVPVENIGFCCVRAFLLAELTASLEWQLYHHMCTYLDFNWQHSLTLEVLFLLLVYVSIYFLMWTIDRHYIQRAERGIKVTKNELVVAVLIGVGAFALSNLSFLQTNTPFSGQNSSDILYIRTLVDLCGVAILYAYHIQRIENYTRYELMATSTILKNQYDQYCMSKETIDLINRKYHDLKHQIAALRTENSPERRQEWLDEMESDIRQYEAENKTGNNVLDTLLTSKSLYCQKNGITLTCVADGSRMGFMKVMDICAIFGNALDNAIESTVQLKDPEQRLIHVSVYAQKVFLVIQIENYFGGQLTFENGLPITTKTDKAYHGFGVKSIKSAVEHYDGSMTMETDNGWFRLNILLPLPENLE